MCTVSIEKRASGRLYGVYWERLTLRGRAGRRVKPPTPRLLYEMCNKQRMGGKQKDCRVRLTLRAVRGRGKVYHTVIRRALLKGLRKGTQTAGLGRLSDCKAQSKGHTQTQWGQRYWTHIYSYTYQADKTPPNTKPVHSKTHNMCSLSSLQVKLKKEEKIDYKTDGLIGG